MFQDDQHDSKLFVFLVKFMAGTSLQQPKKCSSWSRSCFFKISDSIFVLHTISFKRKTLIFNVWREKNSHFLLWSKHNIVYFVTEQKLPSVLNKKCKQNNTKLCFQTKNCAAFVFVPLLLLLLFLVLLLEYCCICTGNVSSHMWF